MCHVNERGENLGVDYTHRHLPRFYRLKSRVKNQEY